MVELLVVMAIFGAITAYAAKSRGRSPVGWFIAGAIGGVIALALVFILPPPNAHAPKTASAVAAPAIALHRAAPRASSCGKCGRQMPADAAFCPYCAAVVEAHGTANVPPLAPSQPSSPLFGARPEGIGTTASAEAQAASSPAPGQAPPASIEAPPATGPQPATAENGPMPPDPRTAPLAAAPQPASEAPTAPEDTFARAELPPSSTERATAPNLSVDAAPAQAETTPSPPAAAVSAARPAAAAANPTYCPDCAESLPPGARHCPYCGVTL